MVLKGFIGHMRSGKTLAMTVHAYKEYLAGRRVYSNLWFSFPHTRITANDLDNAIRNKDTDVFNDSCICIDELHVFMDSRASGQARSRMLSYFITQSGKLHNTVLWTSQFLRQVDVRVRLNTSQLFRTRRVVRDRRGVERELSQDDTRTDFIIKVEKYSLRDALSGLAFVLVKRFTIKKPIKWFSYYDTRERVYYEEQEDRRKKKDDVLG